MRLPEIGFTDMPCKIKWLPTLILGLAACFLPLNLPAMTAKEILDQGAKQNLGEGFRVSLSVKTFKKNKLQGEHVLWLMAKLDQGSGNFFVDFEAPPESKGLRFLVKMGEGKETEAFMYLPATGKTLALALDDPSTDIGGTGLSMEDIQGFAPRANETATLVREETIEGKDCYVIKIDLPCGEGERLLWVSKNDLFVLKSEQVDPQGKIKRTFRVVEFFKTEQGKEFPREEEILIPDKHIRIQVRQENAVFGIEIPEEVLDPDKFGAYKWKG